VSINLKFNSSPRNCMATNTALYRMRCTLNPIQVERKGFLHKILLLGTHPCSWRGFLLLHGRSMETSRLLYTLTQKVSSLMTSGVVWMKNNEWADCWRCRVKIVPFELSSDLAYLLEIIAVF
jgi:hypothetical protein